MERTVNETVLSTMFPLLTRGGRLVWNLSRHQSNLSQRLLKMQDEERRRVARDLHDCTGQTLTALKMSVADLEKRLQEGHCTSGVLCDINALADQALHELSLIHISEPTRRTPISYAVFCLKKK